MTWKVSVPSKVILFGEWAVTEGHPALAVALSPQFQASLHKGSAEEGIVFRDVSASLTERWNPFLQEVPDAPYFHLAARVVRCLAAETGLPLETWQGWEYDFERHWRLEEGRGSSSALVLSLCVWAFHLQGNGTPPPAELWSLGRRVLRQVQSARASGLDLATQIMGGALLLRDEHPSTLPHLNFPKELCLVHTGKKYSTPEQLRHTTLDASWCAAIARSTEDFLAGEDWVRAIDEHHALLATLGGVVPDFVLQAREEWMAKHWVKTLKTTGAGGGDALLCWLNPEHQRAFAADLARRGWWQAPAGQWKAPGYSLLQQPASEFCARKPDAR